ncbi:MAG TPA: hypothetical protein VGL93_13320 [Streptosporangiaceae bacterium]|jgi:hypothetical protein
MSEDKGPDAPDGARPSSVRPWWRRRVVVAGGAAVAVLAAGAVVGVRAFGGPAPLPEPRVLARDPVPAGPIVRTAPANCGISAKTLADLVPRTEVDGAGEGGGCAWSTPATDARGMRDLSVDLTVVPAGPGVPGAIGTSAIGGAIVRYRAAAVAKDPVAGLGDEASATDEVPGAGNTHSVVFRAGNLVATVQYQIGDRTADLGRDRSWSARAIRDGVFRAAADVAASVGAPAAPRTAVAPAGPAPAVFPTRMCDVVPKALRDRLVDDGSDVDTDTDGGDPLGAADAIAGHRTASCTWSSDSRHLTAAITTSDATEPGAAVRDVTSEYLRRYAEARDEPPISAHDARYFHALAGLGDQGFCAYLQESSYPGLPADAPARCVVRVGVSLVSITYGSISDAYDQDGEPLTEQEAVGGAYAAALPVVRFLRD